MTHTLCPERPRMSVLVQGPLPEDEERRLADHLDHCPDCQERAEELTGLGTWTGHHLTRTAPQLRRVIDAMKNKDQLTAPGMGPLPLDDSMLLSFLQPAPSEDCL
ncbi:MAG TPA: zf-HC2 domain-containing protein, partial [Gemmataceae bacterium]|nr:zf-HC2 domain-containing protein [Gemmataceae bacterium]